MSSLRLGMHTHIYNVFSSGYLSYLACIDSWLKVVDRVVVVDGGSDDGSIERLQEWVGYHPNLQIICDDTTKWYSANKFPWPIVSANVNRGYRELDDMDFSIYVDADVVADVKSLAGLREELSKDRTIPVRRLRRFKFYDGNFCSSERSLAAIVDRQAVENSGRRLGWGMFARTGSLSDHPLWIDEERNYFDSLHSRFIPLLVGDSMPSSTVFVNGQAQQCGHFFFKREEAIEKAQRWNRAVSEFRGERKLFYAEVVYALRKDVCGIERYCTREEMLDYPHLPEIRRVIEEFYQQGMLGGALYRKYSNILWLRYLPLVFACKIYRKTMDKIIPRSSGSEV
jgi:glycosyltransferase involved in cell wall biosynthesis